MKQRLSRGYLQVFKWLYCPFLETIPLNPLDHRYAKDEDGNMIPIISMKPPIPSNFPLPCTCRKCIKVTCKCRMLKIACCQYCSCNARSECKNPFKWYGISIRFLFDFLKLHVNLLCIYFVFTLAFVYCPLFFSCIWHVLKNPIIRDSFCLNTHFEYTLIRHFGGLRVNTFLSLLKMLFM